jgi:hypothetical protein
MGSFDAYKEGEEVKCQISLSKVLLPKELLKLTLITLPIRRAWMLNLSRLKAREVQHTHL